MNRRGRILFRLIAAAGVLLLITAAIFLSVPYRKAQKATEALPGITDALTDMLPETKESGTPTFLPSMPIMVYEKTDYIALIEFPAYDIRLPVRAEKKEEEAEDCPFREYGSAYDGNLVIGGFDIEGQFGFFDQTDSGENVLLTDMRGRTFVYEIMAIRPAKALNTDRFEKDGADLVLYSYKPYRSQYLLVLCRKKKNEYSAAE